MLRRNATRNIEKVLRARSDISPFLVHLTRAGKDDNTTAKQNLESIINNGYLLPGIAFSRDGAMSAAKFAVPQKAIEDNLRYFIFVSFTETPLHEIRCLLDIKYRKVNLEPYGLVFLKDRIMRLGVSPAFYINNVRGDKDAVVRALTTLIETHPEEAAQILPLVAVFGKKLTPEGAPSPSGSVDFSWEREWRCPFDESLPFRFNEGDVFVGLCPDEEIGEFEDLFPPVQFIDPRVSLSRYYPKFHRAARRLDLDYSFSQWLKYYK